MTALLHWYLSAQSIFYNNTWSRHGAEMLITTRIQLLTFKYILYNYVIFIGSMHLAFTFPVVNPSNAVATFAQSTRMQRFLETIKTLSCWYSLESSCWALSDEYPFAKGFNGFSGFLHKFVLANLAVSSIRVKLVLLCNLRWHFACDILAPPYTMWSAAPWQLRAVTHSSLLLLLH